MNAKGSPIVAKDDSGSEADLVLSVTDCCSQLDVWVLNSACSYHMTPRKDWFSSYESMATWNVLMGNDMTCVFRIGSIAIKMHDGT